MASSREHLERANARRREEGLEGFGHAAEAGSVVRACVGRGDCYRAPDYRRTAIPPTSKRAPFTSALTPTKALAGNSLVKKVR